ncbi:MAG: 16S rRNA (cytidine(1402)-2'-O)-methyltransferase, partial [Chlamydiota bacterium]
DTTRFQFLGFLPRKPDEVLRQALCYPGTTVAFESPQRLVETLQAIETIDPQRQVAVAREMTKTFEECRRGTPAELLAHYQAHPPRGEIVLALAQGKLPEEELSLEELVQMLQELHGLSLKEAIKQAARFKNLPKSQVYRQFHHSSKE